MCGLIKSFAQKKSSKSRSTSKKFDNSLLNESTLCKSTFPPSVDSSLQDLIKTMSSQLASITCQFEEFKRKDRAPPAQRDPSTSQEQSMSAPVSQARQDFLDGELPKDSQLPSRKNIDPGLLRVRLTLNIRSWTPST